MKQMEQFVEYGAFAANLAAYNTKNVLFPGEDEKYIQLPFLYPVLALSEEAGEVAGKVAKWVRKSKTQTYDETDAAFQLLREDVKKELGDVLYQLAETARQFGFTLQDVVDTNQHKLSDRADRGVIVGEGDER